MINLKQWVVGDGHKPYKPPVLKSFLINSAFIEMHKLIVLTLTERTYVCFLLHEVKRRPLDMDSRSL